MVFLLAALSWAQDPGPTGGGIEIGTGLRGTLSFVSLRVISPQPVPHFDTRFGIVAMSATNWVTFHDRTNDRVVSLHPVVLGGTVYVGGTSDLHDRFRNYGGFEVLIGHSFTPYDNLFDKTGNLIGRNLTIGARGTFGIEMFTTDHQALYVDGGGGFKTYRGLRDNDDPVAIGTAWVGSGASVEVGTRLYR